MGHNPIIVALDGMSKTDALALSRKLKVHVGGFKVNDLLVQCGASIVEELAAYGMVMADPKLHDIKNTVENAVDVLVRSKAHFITAHASGEVDMLRAGVGKIPQGHPGGILAITVLTSLDEDTAQLVYNLPIKATVLKFARWAALAGCCGIVCSGKELEFLAKFPELKNLIRVVPGIRPAGSDKGDQKRTMTPREALEAGANYLVMGRPIYEKGDPVDNVRRILDEINS